MCYAIYGCCDGGKKTEVLCPIVCVICSSDVMIMYIGREEQIEGKWMSTAGMCVYIDVLAAVFFVVCFAGSVNVLQMMYKYKSGLSAVYEYSIVLNRNSYGYVITSGVGWLLDFWGRNRWFGRRR